MRKEEFLETGYKLASALDVVILTHGGDRLATVLAGLGYTNERLQEISDFINANVTEELFNEYVERKAVVEYVEGLQEIEKYIEMAKGYEEMGDINLKISQDSFQAEEEGEKRVNEMVTEDTKEDNII